MKDKILIVGGYGKVGSIISKHLSELYPNKVIIAGRDKKKAMQFAETLSHKVIPYAIDINHLKEDSILNEVQLVIVCIDQVNTQFVKWCITKEIKYIDITANQNFLSQVELLDKDFKNKNTTAVLSIGLAPGITNLLAQNIINKQPEITAVNIYILLGIGEKHGEAAYRWTFNNLHASYKISDKSIKSFTLPKSCDLFGKRKFYTFNFSDQHTLLKTTNSKNVITRMAFDSRLLTNSLGFMRKIGVSRIFKNKVIQDKLIKLFLKFNIGNDSFGVKVITENNNKEIYSSTVTGNGEGKITAYVTIEIVKHLLNNKVNSGVFHIHQLIEDIPNFLAHLKQYDSSIEIDI